MVDKPSSILMQRPSLSSLQKQIKAGDWKYMLWKIYPGALNIYFRLTGRSDSEAYSAMQKVIYEAHARIDSKAFVVGMFEDHEKYPYQSYLLKVIPEKDYSQIVALDFACGPGRMVRRMSQVIRRCDGIDISSKNIKDAKEYCEGLPNPPYFFVNHGQEFEGISSDSYDLVYSTIALQHIPVHKIRALIHAEMFRVLKPGAYLSLQMAYATSMDTVIARAHEHGYPAKFAQWREDAVGAADTNGFHDVVITEESLPLVKEDLEKAGFTQFCYELAPLPHVCHYDHWIFLRARKP